MTRSMAILGCCGSGGAHSVTAFRDGGTAVLDLPTSLKAQPLGGKTHAIDVTDADALGRVAEAVGNIDTDQTGATAQIWR